MGSIPLEDIAKNLSPISWDILKMLQKSEYLSYSEIKNKIGVSQEKASKEIARLEGALLITSRRDEIDQRILKFSLTENGLEILNYKSL